MLLPEDPQPDCSRIAPAITPRTTAANQRRRLRPAAPIPSETRLRPATGSQAAENEPRRKTLLVVTGRATVGMRSVVVPQELPGVTVVGTKVGVLAVTIEGEVAWLGVIGAL